MFKQGDKVICIKDCEKSSVCARKGDIGFMDATWNLIISGGSYCTSLNNWKLINKQMKTLNNLEVGDILVKHGYRYKVLAVLPGLVAFSLFYDHEKFGYWYTIKQLEINGYTPEPEVQEMTVKEVSEKLGYEVKIVKE